MTEDRLFKHDQWIKTIAIQKRQQVYTQIQNVYNIHLKADAHEQVKQPWLTTPHRPFSVFFESDQAGNAKYTLLML